MPISEAKKRANAKYQAKTIASLACRVKIEEAEQFKAICENAGTTSNATLRAFVYSCIKSGSPAPSAPQQAPQPDGSMVSIKPEDLDTMRRHLERYEYDEAAFLARAIKQQIDIDLRHSRMGSNIELVFERLEQKKKQEAEERERLLAERDSQEGV